MVSAVPTSVNAIGPRLTLGTATGTLTARLKGAQFGETGAAMRPTEVGGVEVCFSQISFAATRLVRSALRYDELVGMAII
jgi:hypothetical protein